MFIYNLREMAEEVNHNSKQNKNKKNKKKNLILQKKNWDLCFLEM